MAASVPVPRPKRQSGAVTSWPLGHPKGVKLHEPQARKRTALIGPARFGTTGHIERTHI